MKTKHFLLICLFGMLTVSAQNGNNAPVPPGVNATVDKNGNFHEITDVNTGRIYTDKNGSTFMVFQTKSGKYYVITGISAKTGKPKRKYIKV